jgi:uncharacterized protein YneF (UPF0154 family)
MALKQIRWWWILAGGFGAEIVLFLFVPIQLLPGGGTVLLYIIIPLCLLATGIAGWWVARKAGSAYLVHGVLVGVVALLIYGALTWSQPLPTAYIVANYLKIVGGLVGGWYAARHHARRAPADAAAPS